ncbi:DNA-dependent RNA polymerase subunit epsilon [Cytobacillus gottheilii]|uniref:DNA-dependent RNA polymerase subunit epsilon n=1 Tax=Cytobacillus gottheilii TaxID=859144 RepID=UPI0009B992E6|nr:RNA polymerase epsilon subunit [Cytobacillus gottheilii]
MVYKVYFQEVAKEVPVREKTKTIFVEGESERDVRSKLKKRPYNIEFVAAVEGSYLDYEKQNEDFKVLEIE